MHRSENCLLIIKDDESSKIPVNQLNSLIIESEQINITSSLMVDEIVYENMDSDFNRDYKKKLLSICSDEVRYNNSIVTIENALDLFTLAVINFLPCR